MTTAGRRRGPGTRPVHATAHAAGKASRDAEDVARSAADTRSAVLEAASEAGVVASDAKEATAITVAAAAVAAADIANKAAAGVQADAVARAIDVAAAAAAALKDLAARLPDDLDPGGAGRAAAYLAAQVAADVVAQAHSTAQAADRVAHAVELAAQAAALAATTAAAIVEMAAGTAEVSASAVAGASSATQAASDVAVGSSSRVAQLARQRVAHLRKAPMVTELRRAVERDELQLHYQPMYSMETGEVVAVEALLRWQHPTRGMLAPIDFLEVAEGPDLLTLVGDWVLTNAVTQAATWQRDLGRPGPTMWVNIACDQLGRHHLIDVCSRLLSDHRLTSGTLGLEVTERQVARRADAVASDLRSLRELGVKIAVDDFGTGYASLDYLRRFCVDEIKIDRSFVAGLTRDRTDTAVTTSVIALGQALDISVVAEGVETQVQYDRLRELGCSISQGYLLHRPAPADTVTALLRRAETRCAAFIRSTA